MRRIGCLLIVIAGCGSSRSKAGAAIPPADQQRIIELVRVAQTRADDFAKARELGPGSTTVAELVASPAAPDDARTNSTATIPTANVTRSARVPEPIVGFKLSVTAWSCTGDTRVGAASNEPQRSPN